MQLVALPRTQVASVQKSDQVRGMLPLPAIFRKILGLSKEAQVEKKSSLSVTSSSELLAFASKHMPKAALKEPKKGPSKKQRKQTEKLPSGKAKKASAKKPVSKKASHASKIQEKKPIVRQSTKAASVYKPGDMNSQRALYVQEQVAHGGMTKREAMKAWSTSLRRADLLKDLSVSELVKRKFVPPGSNVNPFAKMVSLPEKSPSL